MEKVLGLLLAKIEETYGTDSTPDEATEAILTKGMPKFSVVGKTLDRGLLLSFFGKASPVNLGDALKITFTTELKGSGTPGTPSRYGCLFQACGFTEAATPGASVSYTPNSDISTVKSVTLYFWAGGTQHKIMGCVGTFKLNFKVDEYQTIDWELTGLYAGGHATDVALPSPTHEDILPIIWKGANFKYNAVTSLVVDALTLDIGNTISQRNDANAASGISQYFVGQRDAKGTMDPEKMALATLNPWTIYENSTQAALETKPSGTAGNLVEVVATGLTLEAPQYGDRNNLITWALSFTINPTVSTGNNEIVITFK